MAECGLTVDPKLMRDNAVTRSEGQTAAGAFLDQSAPPTAIVCAVDNAALGAYAALAERGLTVAKDVSIIAYDGTQDAANATPPLTTFAVDSRIAGERSAKR